MLEEILQRFPVHSWAGSLTPFEALRWRVETAFLNFSFSSAKETLSHFFWTSSTAGEDQIQSLIGLKPLAS
jgi:hypothetical protein